jgi:hypothetical protein
MRLLILSLLFLTLVVPAHADQTASAAAHASVFAFPAGDAGDLTPVKALDDPENPYRDQYGAFDRWAFAHASRNITPSNQGDFQIALAAAMGKSCMTGPELMPDGPEDYSHGPRIVWSSVDENGYMVPHYDYIYKLVKQGGEAPATLQEIVARSDKRFTPRAHFWSLGYLDDALGQEVAHARDMYLATAYPAIPAWIAQRQLDTVFLPDNTAVTLEPVQNSSAYTARHYGADGALLKEAQVDGEDQWQVALLGGPRPEDSPNYKTYDIPNLGPGSQKISNSEDVGWRYVVLGDKAHPLSVIDYWQGKEYSAQESGADFLGNLPVDYKYFNRMNGKFLVEVYAAQQRIVNSARSGN